MRKKYIFSNIVLGWLSVAAIVFVPMHYLLILWVIIYLVQMSVAIWGILSARKSSDIPIYNSANKPVGFRLITMISAGSYIYAFFARLTDPLEAGSAIEGVMLLFALNLIAFEFSLTISNSRKQEND